MIPELASLTKGVITLPILIGFLFFCLVFSYARAWYRLRHIPGPLTARFSYAWMFRIALTGKQSQLYSAVNEKYGSLARIGPNDLITSSPELIRRMSSARSAYGRSSWYTAMRMDPYDESLFSMTDSHAHDRLKAKMASAYGGKENPSLEADLDEQLNNFTQYIRDKYISTEAEFRPLDLATAVQYFTMDAVTKVAYGKEFGYLATDSDVCGYMAAAEEQIPALVVLAEIPFLTKIFDMPWVMKQIGPKKTDSKGIGRMLACVTFLLFLPSQGGNYLRKLNGTGRKLTEI